MNEAIPFDRYGPGEPASPVIVSVPHAGRDYPAALRQALRVPSAALVLLEDRHVDAVALTALKGEVALVQRRPRAWIDLNRGETERDARVDEGAPPASAAASTRVRSGLGLVPRRAGRHGDLWDRRWTGSEVDARILADHRPYHAALAAALAAARARFGTAVLLDLHSMPPPDGRGAPRLVLGDRFGRSAAPRFVARAEAAASAAGLTVARNAPYAGGHIVDRHGAPSHGVHAIQLEIDRALYLDDALDRPDPARLPLMAALVRAMIDALADEAITDWGLAAE